MSRAKLVDHYLERSGDPGFKISDIRRELEAQNIPDEEIKTIVMLVDKQMQTRAITKGSNSKANEFIVAGAILMIIGAGITIGTYTGLIAMGNSFLIVYGPFFVGMSILVGGIAKKRASN